MRVRHHFQFFVYDAIFEHIGAVTNQIAWFGPLFAALNVGFLYRIECKTRRQIGKPGQRFIQLNFQCPCIDSTNAKFIRCGFAIDNSLSIINTRQRSKPGKRRQRFWINQTLPAIDKILRRYWRTIRPSRIVAQRKRPDAVIVTLPLGSDARHDLTLLILVDQPFK